MSTPTVVKATGAADFLAFVPRMIGYTPVHSVVVVPFAENRSLGAMRFDLPAENYAEVASTIVGMALRVDGATALAAIVYTDQPGATTVPILEAIEAAATRCGLHVTDTLYVAADGWGSVLGGVGPSPLEEIPVHDELPPAAETDQASGAVLPETTEEQRQAVAEATKDLAAAVALLVEGDSVTEMPPPKMLGMVVMLDDLPSLWESALEWPLDELSPEHTALAGWLMARPSLRDVGLVQWAGKLADGDEAFDAQLRWESGEDYPAHLAMRMWGEGDRPDVARLEPGLALCRQVAALSPDNAGPLALAAWISWALGRSTHASAYADMAQAIDEEHGLAGIVQSFVSAGHLPDWAFRARS